MEVRQQRKQGLALGSPRLRHKPGKYEHHQQKYLFNADINATQSQGTITQACMCASGKFEVAIEGVDKTGQYIVYKTGPVTDGLYDYAVVTTPLGILG